MDGAEIGWFKLFVSTRHVVVVVLKGLKRHFSFHLDFNLPQAGCDNKAVEAGGMMGSSCRMIVLLVDREPFVTMHSRPLCIRPVKEAYSNFSKLNLHINSC